MLGEFWRIVRATAPSTGAALFGFKERMISSSLKGLDSGAEMASATLRDTGIILLAMARRGVAGVVVLTTTTYATLLTGLM